MAFQVSLIRRYKARFSSRARRRSALPACCFRRRALRSAALRRFSRRTRRSSSVSVRSQRAMKFSSPSGRVMWEGRMGRGGSVLGCRASSLRCWVFDTPLRRGFFLSISIWRYRWGSIAVGGLTTESAEGWRAFVAASSLAAFSASRLARFSSRRCRASTDMTVPSPSLVTGLTLNSFPEGSCSIARRSACLTASSHTACLSNCTDRSRFRSAFLLYFSGFLVYQTISP